MGWSAKLTTDFAEALLEFITPVDGDIEHMLTFMRDLHRYTARNMGDERMWPLSMPCYIAEGQDIELAQYGTSNTGRFKTLYREGLKNRYGALMQTISGVHYNFSLPTNCMRRFVQNALPAAASHLLMRCYVAALNILKCVRWTSTRSRRLV